MVASAPLWKAPGADKGSERVRTSGAIRDVYPDARLAARRALHPSLPDRNRRPGRRGKTTLDDGQRPSKW